MGETPKYKWPYPEGGDKPQGHIQMKALATKIETTVAAQLTRLDAALTTRNMGQFGTTEAGSLPSGVWKPQPVGSTTRDPGKWFNNTAKTIRVPKGAYLIAGRLMVHLPTPNANHHAALGWWVTKVGGAGYALLGQTEFVYTTQAGADVKVQMRSDILYATETVDIRPAIFGYGGGVHHGMALWTGSEINVACLVDGVTLGATALKNIDQHMPPNPAYNAATDYGIMHAEPIKP